MTIGAKPGQYVWNEKTNSYVGRINKDGTEDRRFTLEGGCSMMNTLISETGYIPSDPQAFAEKFSDPTQNEYGLRGFAVVLACVDLSPEMWSPKAKEMLGVECDGLVDLLNHVSKDKSIERGAKLDTIGLIVGREIKANELADLASIDQFEKDADKRAARRRDADVFKKKREELEATPKYIAYQKARNLALKLQEMRPDHSTFRVFVRNSTGKLTDKIADGCLALLPFDCVSNRRTETFEVLAGVLQRSLDWEAGKEEREQKAKEKYIEEQKKHDTDRLEIGRLYRKLIKNQLGRFLLSEMGETFMSYFVGNRSSYAKIARECGENSGWTDYLHRNMYLFESVVKQMLSIQAKVEQYGGFGKARA